MMTKEPATTAQLVTAEEYYRSSFSKLFTYAYCGKDGVGRKVYQKQLEGEPYGEPRALLSHREYTAKVKAGALLSGAMGVQRWTSPY